jgi:undecaprenyl-diphosphatase
MNILEAILLGLVQGLTEFLPISSSGHLLLLQDIMGIYENRALVSVMLHLGTLLAVVIFFFKDLLALLKKPYNTLLNLIIATIPAALVMLLIKDHVEALFGPTFYCFGFLITAVVLLLTEIISKKNIGTPAEEVDSKKALAMGLAQAVAVIPGISRSGSTICAGVLSEAKREAVAKFSFLMSVPVILGSSAVSALEISTLQIDALPLLLGMASAFVTGILSIKLMMKAIKKSNYRWFSAYLFLLFALVFTNIFIARIW